jgi:hypothetical protein
VDKSITPHGRVVGLHLFRNAAFCSPCHQFTNGVGEVNGKPLENTEQEWRASRYARTGTGCQLCHMPDGSHEFRGIHDPDMTRKALLLNVWRHESGVALELRNTGAGHALPTYATPRIRVRIDRDGAGQAPLHHDIQRSLVWDLDAGWAERSDTRLLPHQAKRLALELEPTEAAEVTVIVEPDALYHEVVYPNLERSIAKNLGAISRAWLRRAKQRASSSSYVLYRRRCPPWQGTRAECEPVRGE